MTYLKKTIDEFAQDVVEKAQRNLGAYRMVTDRRGRKKKRRADSSGNLRKSLTYRMRAGSDKTRLSFFAKGKAGEYADFVEQGVNGTALSWRPKKGHSPSPYRFKGKNINQKAILDWMKRKPIRLREMKNGKLGGFTKVTEKKKKQAAFLIGRSIAKYGFAPLNYMSDALDDAIPEWTERFSEAVAKDIEEKLG